MPLLRDLNLAMKARLGASSLEDWASYLENCPGETTLPPFRASLRGRIAAFLRHRLVSGAIFILWIAFLLALVFASTRLI